MGGLGPNLFDVGLAPAGHLTALSDWAGYGHVSNARQGIVMVQPSQARPMKTRLLGSYKLVWLILIISH